MSIQKVLKEHGVTVGVQGQKGTKHKELASDLLRSAPEDRDRILTKHGARIVFSTKGRLSYKDLALAVMTEAERTIAQERRQHRVQLEGLIGRKLLDHAEEGNGGVAGDEVASVEEDDTAGN